jgi:hypothetical protein
VRLRRGLRLVEKLLRATATALCRSGGRHWKCRVAAGTRPRDPVSIQLIRVKA